MWSTQALIYLAVWSTCLLLFKLRVEEVYISPVRFLDVYRTVYNLPNSIDGFRRRHATTPPSLVSSSNLDPELSSSLADHPYI